MKTKDDPGVKQYVFNSFTVARVFTTVLANENVLFQASLSKDNTRHVVSVSNTMVNIVERIVQEWDTAITLVNQKVNETV